MKTIKRALSVIVAGALSASLCAMPALATTSGNIDEGMSLRTYTVDIYGGNNGTIHGENHIAVDVEAGKKLSFNDLVVTMNEAAADKYYVKGLREASVNNAYSGQFVVKPSNVDQTSDTTYALSGSMEVTEDTDLVVAYGIKSQRVNYTVRYVDKNGVDIIPADTYTGDIGDRPAPVAKYIDGYLPRVMNTVMPALKGGEETVITFDYVRLDPSYRVIYENEIIRVITPEGEEIVVNPVTEEEAEAAGGVVPIVDATGETIIDEDGNPLAAPIVEENLEDNENPLASANGEAGINTQAQNAASVLSWLLPLLAAVVVAGLIMFFALLIRSKRKNDGKSTR